MCVSHSKPAGRLTTSPQLPQNAVKPFFIPEMSTVAQSLRTSKISLTLSLLVLTSASYSANQMRLEAEIHRVDSSHSHLALKPIGRNFVLSSGVSSFRQSPAVAYNRVDNQYMVVWTDDRNARITGNDIFGQRVSAKGRLLGDNIPIVTEMDSQSDPSIAHNRMDNNYLVTWQQQPFDQDNSDFNDAFGQILSNDGRSGTAFRISDAGFEISSAYNAQYNSYLVTGRVFESGPVPGIFGQTVSHDGGPVDDRITIAAGAAEDPLSAPAPNGQVIYNPEASEFFATWRDQKEENLKGRRISPGGELVGKPIVISHVFPEGFYAASVALDSIRDRYLVVFVRFQGNQMLGQFVSSAGKLIGANFPIEALYSRNTPSIVYSRRYDAYLVVWENGNDIFARLLSARGDAIGNVLRLTRNDTAFDAPRTALNTRTGQFLVVWADQRNLSNRRSRRDIFAQLITVEVRQNIPVKMEMAHM